MFDQSSRYANIETRVITGPDGREIRYVLRRLLPAADAGLSYTEHAVGEGERLDHLAARFLGDSELFWELADMNNALRPADLTDEIGRRLKIALLSG